MSEERPADTEIDIKGIDSDHSLHSAILLQLDCFRIGNLGSDILGGRRKERKGNEREV